MAQTSSRCHIAIKVYNFDEAAAALKAKGIELEEPKAGPDLGGLFSAS